MLSFDTSLSNALKNANTTAFWVLKLYYNDESNFIGVSDRHREDGSDIYYGIVASFGTLRQSLDFFNFTTTIGNLSVTLINSDNSIKGGRFTDLLSTNNFANRKWELFLNTNETSTLDTSTRMIATGIISGEIDFDRNNCTLTLLDNSSKYHKQIPTNIVDSSTYTNAPANNVGKPIPMAYGDFHEKDNIGTIPITHFDKYYNFYKGAFPAIITDIWDVQEAGSEALADSQALHTMDNENIYFYKNGYYPTITGTIDVAGNPEIEYRGGTASVFYPLSTSNLGSESVTGSGAVANEENTSDGSFSTLATWTANGATSNNSVSTMTFAIPQLSKLGEFGSVNTLVRWGTVTDLSGEDNDVFRFTANSANVDIDSMSTNSEVKSNIGSLYSGKTAAWDFEGSIDYSLLSGTANESAEIVESGIVVDFNIEDIEDFSIVETIEGSPITRTVQTRYGTEEIVLEPIKTITRTETLLTPSNINYVYFSGKGRKYGAYIDADSRGNGESGDNGYAENALIENPIYIIEDILRDELSMSSTNIDFATFDTSGNTTNGLLGDIYEDAISDIKFAFSQFKFMNSKSFIERLCKLCFSYVFIGGDGKFKIKTLRRSDDYSSADETIDYRDLSNVKIAKTPLDAVKNSILIKYKHDYGGQQNKSEATATDSTSQGTTVNGFNQVLKLQIEANEILDDTTATKLAEAYLHLLKDRKNKISFSTSRPRYNHLEIGDIINFSNWPSEFKLYGQTLGGSFDSTTTTFDSTTTTFENTAAGYYMITDIAKNINSSNIEAIRVS
jgi:hypothetical protein